MHVYYIELLQGCHFPRPCLVTFPSPETDVALWDGGNIRAFIEKVKYEIIKSMHLICPLKFVPLIIINVLHYISLLNYMCYKGIIGLKDAYRDPSSLQSGSEFSRLINKGVPDWEVLTSREN